LTVAAGCGVRVHHGGAPMILMVVVAIVQHIPTDVRPVSTIVKMMVTSAEVVSEPVSA
jgi:hypothetical protein